MAATKQTIRDFLGSSNWNYGEQFIIRWQFGILGSFQQALIDVIKLADEENLSRLAIVFPREVDAFRAWSCGDLARRLRDAGLEI